MSHCVPRYITIITVSQNLIYFFSLKDSTKRLSSTQSTNIHYPNSNYRRLPRTYLNTPLAKNTPTKTLRIRGEEPLIRIFRKFW